IADIDNPLVNMNPLHGGAIVRAARRLGRRLRAAVSHHPHAAAKACARCCTAPHHRNVNTNMICGPAASTISAPTYPSLTRHGRFVRRARRIERGFTLLRPRPYNPN
ncbi:hypothetical protein, partial [Burkholderia cenocepacia]|uniref:hypothetical protein n=1 Tax=Burkholderia cenocepacia TaxID=95486 RepID=UPI002AB01504